MTNQPNPEIQLAMRLINEVDTATEQLSLGLNQMTTHGWVAHQPGAVFTSLAVGIERILKLTIGESARNAGGSYPASWRGNRSGHDLDALYQGATESIQTAATGANPYVGRLLKQLVDDPYWPSLLESLDLWAQASGRYANLDALAGKTTASRHAWEPWEQAEHRVLTDTGAYGRLDENAIHSMRMRIAESLMIWWHTYFCVWQHGLVGARGREVSSSLDPKNVRHLNPDVRALISGR